MNANQDNRAREAEDVVELGVASVETRGGVFETGEPMGLIAGVEISDE